MRIAVFFILLIMVTALVICAGKVRRSDRKIARSVWSLLLSLIPPITGNLIIIAATTKLMAEAGCYIYFIGMDLVAAFLLKFTLDYCGFRWDNKVLISLSYSLFTIDIIQYLCNPFFRQAFDTREIMVDGAPYYQLVPYLGQTYHRVIVYAFFFASLIMFAVKVNRTSRVYNEKYRYILLCMILAGAWESFYILSGTPIDTSMIGFGVFGLLVTYFVLYYNPVHLISGIFGSIAAGLHESLFFFNEEGKCIWTNKSGRDLLGLGESNPDDVGEKLYEFFPEITDKGDEWTEEAVRGKGKQKKYYHLEGHIAREESRKNEVIGSFTNVRDDTKAHEKLETERYNARHDSLTGLYNKDQLFRCIRNTLSNDPAGNYQVAFVDVNEFKMVNDIFGKDFGDYALKKIGEWIASDMPDNAFYGRLAGDTFGVFEPVEHFDPERINDRLRNFIVKQGDKEHHIIMQVGVYQIDDRDIDVAVMFDRARMALSKKKRVYSNIAFYNDSIRESMLWHQKISAELQTAIEEKQIRPHYQPILDVNGRVVGAEALTRWYHPEKGLLSPGTFIPDLEQTGRIIDVDRYMWRCACEQLKEWETIHPDFFISVNISPVDFYYMDVRLEINKLIREFGIDPSKVRLEITEAVMMSNLAERIQTLNRLKKDGFIVEMDDFGSGYSSLNMLKDMPVDLIKLDMEFLHDSMFNDKAQTILSSIVNLIGMLNMDSLVEGVETKEQFDMLSKMGCKYYQGYYFAKPLPIGEFEEYCRSNAA